MGQAEIGKAAPRSDDYRGVKVFIELFEDSELLSDESKMNQEQKVQFERKRQRGEPKHFGSAGGSD